MTLDQKIQHLECLADEMEYLTADIKRQLELTHNSHHMPRGGVNDDELLMAVDERHQRHKRHPRGKKRKEVDEAPKWGGQTTGHYSTMMRVLRD